MLLPGMAAAKVGRVIGNGIRMAAIELGTPMKYGRTFTDIMGTTVGALTMRHAENFREASGVFYEIYNKGIEKGLPENEARRIASESASTDYNLNYLNTAFDLYNLLLY